MAQALPHGGRLGLADALPIVNGTAGVRHLFDPIGKAAQEFSIIVGKAGREIERPFRTNSADGTSGYTQLALETRIIVERLIVMARFTVDQHCSQENEVPIFWVNQIAVNAHV